MPQAGPRASPRSEPGHGAGISGYRFEAFETQRQPIPVRPVSRSGGQMNCSAMQTLQRLEHGTVIQAQEPIRHVKPVVRVDTDQMCVKGCMMGLGQRKAVRNNGLA